MNLIYDDKAFLNSRGGISRYFINLISYLKYFDLFQPTVLCPTYKNIWLRECNLEKKGKFIQEYIPNIFLKNYNNLINYNIKFKKNFVFHETYYGSKLRSKNMKGKIITIHDCILEKLPHLFNFPDDILKKKKKSIKEADHIICVSQSTANDLKDIYGIAESKYSIIYHGTNFMNFSKNLKYESKGKYFLYVGERGSYKNFNLILKAFSQSEELKNNYLLIAFGGGKFNELEIDLIKNLSLSLDRIINVTGDDNLLAKLYQNAEALIISSIYEGFGLPLIEAFSLGCPVICSENSSLSELGKDSVIFFDYRYFTDLKNMIENFISTPDKKNVLKKKSLARSKEFSIEQMGNKTIDVYKKFFN